MARQSKYPRKKTGEQDRTGKRIQVPFSDSEFAAVSAVADDEFQSVAETARDLIVAGLESRKGEPVPLTGFAAARAEEKTLRNQLLQFELAKKRRETLTVDQVLGVVEKDYANIRSRILNLAQTVTGLNLDQKAELKNAIQDCMTDLSGGQRETWDDLAAAE